MIEDPLEDQVALERRETVVLDTQEPRENQDHQAELEVQVRKVTLDMELQE